MTVPVQVHLEAAGLVERDGLWVDADELGQLTRPLDHLPLVGSGRPWNLSSEPASISVSRLAPAVIRAGDASGTGRTLS
jgi:hypothetical protein